ncbi:MAG: hypothetical protein KDA37_09185, partial [Planctomycetales bacterium]|nr:hypothetical protein [Planctomycetales bacterium]
GGGAADADDVIDLTYTVFEHPIASLDEQTPVSSVTLDIGSTTLGMPISAGLSLYSFSSVGGPTFASLLELDAVNASGDASAFRLSLGGFEPLALGGEFAFEAMLLGDAAGEFAATFELILSGEDLPGDQSQSLLLTLTGAVDPLPLLGDFNNDLAVDAADYTAWRDALGTAATLNNNGVNDGIVDQQDYQLWRAHYGESAAALALAVSAPSPGALPMACMAVGCVLGTGRRVKRQTRCRA